MKRHPSLEPFSRDHNTGLILARQLGIAAAVAPAVAAFVAAWRDELKDHFDEEERLLGPLCRPEEQIRLKEEHDRIRALAALGEKEALDEAGSRGLGQLLDEHIRWEERVLFPSIEAHASEEDLAALAAETDKLEQRRGELATNARRKELVERRSRKNPANLGS